MENEGTVFALLGESGVGKTNEMCAVTETLAESHIVLFLNAADISENVEKSLSKEFNWGFREQINFPEIVRRLTRIGRALNKRVIIVIDALDEARAVNFERSISELAGNLSSSGGVVKLIVSVKTSYWRRFSTFGGTILKLVLHLDTSWYPNNDEEDPRPFVLTKFDDSEKKEALGKYSEFYSLSDIPAGMKRSCEHPFLLRVVAELYANRKEIPSDISEGELIEFWIRKKLSQTDDPEKCRLTLMSLAHAIYDESLEKNIERIPYSQLWEASTFSILKFSKVPDMVGMSKKLVSIGMITSLRDHNDVHHYSFYYGPVRDYFLATYFLKFNELSTEQLESQVPKILENPVLRSALFWYLRKAPYAKIMKMKSWIRFRATEFVKTYNEILNDLVPKLKPNLRPYTHDEIGICFTNKEDYLEFGLFPIRDENDERVVELKFRFQNEQSFKEYSALGAIFIEGGGEQQLFEYRSETIGGRICFKTNKSGH